MTIYILEFCGLLLLYFRISAAKERTELGDGFVRFSNNALNEETNKETKEGKKEGRKEGRREGRKEGRKEEGKEGRKKGRKEKTTTKTTTETEKLARWGAPTYNHNLCYCVS